MGNKIYKTELDYINKYYSDDNFLEVNKDNTEIDIALFALSTYNKPRETSDPMEMSVINVNQREYFYYYQQEVGVIKDRANLGKNGLDYAIILITSSTIVEKRKAILVKDNRTPISQDEIIYEMKSSEKNYIKNILEKGNVLNNSDPEAEIQKKISGLFESHNIKEMSSNPRILYISVEEKKEDEIAGAIAKAISFIKLISNKKTNIHYYNNGGFREIPLYLEMIMSLIKDDPNINIEKNIIEYYDGNAVLKTAGRGVEDFVSGINEFRNYGKMDSLNKYYRYGDDNVLDSLTENDMKLLDCLNRISVGIQSNLIANFQAGLDDLNSIKELGKEMLQDHFLRLFFDEIINDFSFVEYKNSNRSKYIIEMMRWAHKKGYYQQVITMIESFVPLLLKECNKYNYNLPNTYINSKRKYTHDSDNDRTVFNACVIHNCVAGKQNIFDGRAFDNNEINVISTDKIYRLIQNHKVIKDIRNKVNHISYRNYSVSDIHLKEHLNNYINQLNKVINSSSEKLVVTKVS